MNTTLKTAMIQPGIGVGLTRLDLRSRPQVIARLSTPTDHDLPPAAAGRERDHRQQDRAGADDVSGVSSVT